MNQSRQQKCSCGLSTVLVSQERSDTKMIEQAKKIESNVSTGCILFQLPHHASFLVRPRCLSHFVRRLRLHLCLFHYLGDIFVSIDFTFLSHVLLAIFSMILLAQRKRRERESSEAGLWKGIGRADTAALALCDEAVLNHLGGKLRRTGIRQKTNS
eukprot:SAG31_NODE_101_length_25195_cov_67.436758_7_plen_156_part_00